MNKGINEECHPVVDEAVNKLMEGLERKKKIKSK